MASVVTVYGEHARVTKSQWASTNQIYSCMPHRFPGEIVETQVWEALEELQRNPELASEIIEAANKEHSKLYYGHEEEKLRNKVYQAQWQDECFDGEAL